jgi:hypothetical protein
LPQQQCAGTTDPIELFNICIWGLDAASMVLVILDGTDADLPAAQTARIP